MKPIDYKTKFNNADIRSDGYKEFCSKKITGENNPAFGHGGKFSPFSKKFVGYDTLQETDIENAIDSLFDKAKKTRRDNNNNTSSLEYYTSRGMTVEEAEAARRYRQQTFTKEICIQKYGFDEGTKIWLERQEKWMNSLSKAVESGVKKIRSGPTSACERELTEEILSRGIGIERQFVISSKKYDKCFSYDIRCDNKIIEFNGTYWHCDPRKYNEDFYHTIKKMTAKEIWDHDEKKLQEAQDCGYELLVVWEFDYRRNKQKEIDRCIKFLTQ